MDPILDDLNPAQREAVEHASGPLMVVAGAGSGKTRVITRRIARLLRDEIASDAVLALTFTNKAAQEMARRVEDLGGRRVHVATFHSACARFLRTDGKLLGYPRDYTIYDVYDRDSCVKMLMQERDLPLTPIKPGHVGSQISRLKNLDISPDDYREQHGDQPLETLPGLVAELYAPYQERMRKSGAMDFDDLLLVFRDLLTQHEEVRARYQERFAHVLVDEFQDTNRVQYQLTRLLTGPQRNVCVVGDPDQSIYRFRGAEIRNILDFHEDHPEAVVCRLEVNYRSTARILRAAQGIIENNEERIDRDLHTDNDDGDPVAYHRFGNSYDENAAVGDRILSLVRGGTSPDEIAVFYRSHFLSRGVEEVLRRAMVPYEVVGGLSFYERREIKDLLAYLRVAINPLDNVSMERIINVPPRFLGKVTVDKLLRIASREEMSLYEVVSDPEMHEGLPARARKNLAVLNAVFDDVRERAEIGVRDALDAVLEGTGYVEYACNIGDPQDVAREENINELVNDTADFESRFGGGVAEYLSRVSLMTSEDRKAREGATVSLMTVHAAKGLEFDHVFVIGLEDGLFPSSRSEEEGDIEEERRLMYVAITRGRRTVHLSGCESRMVRGYESEQEPSRFLREIPDDCLERSGRSRRDPWDDWSVQEDPGHEAMDGVDAALDPQIDVELEPDMRVAHATYGEGTVVSVSGAGIQARAVVRFGDGRERDLLLEYAGLRLVDRGSDW